ncbi:hypothetical protein [Arthrobacter sp. SD76]|uniref:hypothetical protein n=1 Tax=Arthrobacter sp. SD76 TaxID=3415007 RepID=UPI003C71A1B9
MKRILAALGVTSLALFGASATANATGGASGDNEKITICHATGSETNPYVPITIDLNGLNGHVGHQHDEDIIPANNGKVLPGGQNLDKVDWWNAGCTKPGGAVTPTPKPTHPHDDNGKKITICHATGSETNPYVVITIALQGLNGHAGAHHQHAEDIIPPNDGKVMPAGQNWTAEGQATWNNDCVPVKVPPTTPPTTPPTVPPTVTPTTPPTGAVVPHRSPVAQQLVSQQAEQAQWPPTTRASMCRPPWPGTRNPELPRGSGARQHCCWPAQPLRPGSRWQAAEPRAGITSKSPAAASAATG